MEKSQKMSEFFISLHIFWASFGAHKHIFRFFERGDVTPALISLFMRRNLWTAFCSQDHSRPGENLVGSTFNIQNFIPHKSQKTKAVPETNRAKEFQRGTAGVPESAKDGARGLAEGSDIGLGAGCRRFESCHSDQTNRRKRLFAEKARVFKPFKAL